MELYNEEKLVWIPGYGRHNTESGRSYNTYEEALEAYNNYITTEFDSGKLSKEAKKLFKKEEYKDKDIRGCCTITIERDKRTKKTRYHVRMGLKTWEKKHVAFLKNDGESEQIRHLNFPYLYNGVCDSDSLHTKTVKGTINGRPYDSELNITSISCVSQEYYKKYYPHIDMVNKEEFEKANWN